MELVRGEWGTDDCMNLRGAIMVLSLHIDCLWMGSVQIGMAKELTPSAALDGPEGGQGAIRAQVVLLLVEWDLEREETDGP